MGYIPWDILLDLRLQKDYLKNPPIGIQMMASDMVLNNIREYDPVNYKQNQIDFIKKLYDAYDGKYGELPFSTEIPAIVEYNYCMASALTCVKQWAETKRCFYIDKILQEDFEDNELPEVSFEILKRMPFGSIYLETPSKEYHGILVTRFDEIDPEIKSKIESDIQGAIVCDVIYKDKSIRHFNIPFNDKALTNINEVYESSSDEFFLQYQIERGKIYKNHRYTLFTSHFKDEHALESKERFENYITKEFNPFIHIVLNSLLYINSKKPDITEKNRIEVRTYDTKKKKTVKSEIIREELAVSYVKRRKETDIRYIKDPNHIPKKLKNAYWRKAHWHLYWVGKGRERPEVKWIEPVLCGVGELKDSIQVEVLEKN